MEFGFLLMLAILVLMIASFWVVVTKASQPGWASIVPIYNIIVLLKIANKPWWWVLLYLIPLVGLIITIVVSIAVAKNFGKTAGFGIGLTFLPFIFYPVLAWGDAQYTAQA